MKYMLNKWGGQKEVCILRPADRVDTVATLYKGQGTVIIDCPRATTENQFPYFFVE